MTPWQKRRTFVSEGAHGVGGLGVLAGQVEVRRVHFEARLLAVQLDEELGHDDGLLAGPGAPLQAEHVQQAALELFRSFAELACNRRKSFKISSSHSNGPRTSDALPAMVD